MCPVMGGLLELRDGSRYWLKPVFRWVRRGRSGQMQWAFMRFQYLPI